MQYQLPVPGSWLWIRQERWRVEAVRRAQRGVVRLDVAGRGGVRTFLAPFDRPTAAAPSGRPRWIRSRAFAARLAGVLARTGSCRGLSSAVDAGIEIFPYQLEPALALLNGAARVLLADAVGLGKTVQAGLAIGELQRRRPGLRALVIVPATLQRQWAHALRAQFRIDVWQADAEGLAALARSADRHARIWDRPGVCLASMDYLKQPHVVGAAGHRPWDLIVIDEAHGACGESQRHDAAAALAGRARQLLLLTATPHSGDEAAFARLRDLGRLQAEDEAPIVFRRTRAVLGMTRRRRVRWLPVRLTPAEQRLLEALGAFERDLVRRAGAAHETAALLLLSVFRKRALSTAAAFTLSIDRRLAWLDADSAAAPRDQWRQPALFAEQDEDDLRPDERSVIAVDLGVPRPTEMAWLRRLRELGRAAARDESKIRRLAAFVRRTAEPIAIFTEFRDSLARVVSALAPLRAVASLHGGLSAVEQHEALDRFSSGAASVLIATDVASQGLNLQARCRTVVNLEIPWNPVRLEQRAGRIDRIGQTREVHVLSLVARHDAEAGVLSHLARRALSADRSVGGETLPMPSEAWVRARLLQGVSSPLPGDPATRISSCRRWARPARLLARQLLRRRALATRWRDPAIAARPWVARPHGLTALRAAARTGAIVGFLAPILDGAGSTIERRLVALHLLRLSRPDLGDTAFVARLRRLVLMSLQSRVRCLGRLRTLECARSAGRDRAMHERWLDASGSSESQPGLFDRRAERTAARLAGERGDEQAALDARLADLMREAQVEMGEPVLAFVLTAEGLKARPAHGSLTT